MKSWNGIVKILEITHTSAKGDILWKQRNLLNLFHTQGEEFILKSVFLGGKANNSYIPNSFYFGLDNRSTLALGDNLTLIASSEPVSNGYSRQSVASTNQFVASISGGVNQVLSPIITFSALGGSWGPVRNLFMATTAGADGYLISSVSLDQPILLNNAENLSLRMGMSLHDCP